MSEITSIWKKLGKRVCAIVLVASFVLPLAPQIEMRVDAADTGKAVKLEFIGEGIQAGATSTQIITDPRESLKVQATVTGDYLMKPGAEAFKILLGSTPQSKHFQISNIDPYLFKPVVGGADGMKLLPDNELGYAEYSIQPVFTANKVTKGTSILSMYKPGGAAPETSVSATVDWPSETGIPLIDSTTIKFQVDKTGNGRVTAVDGYLDTLFKPQLDTVTLSPVDGSTNKFLVNIVSPSTSQVMVATIQLSTGSITLDDFERIEVQITFNAPASDSLIVHAYTPAAAMKAQYDRLSDAVSNPGTIPTMSNGKPYLVLEQGDTLQAIKGKKIGAVNNARSYNGTIDIAWSWDPDDNLYDGLVTYDTIRQQFNVSQPEKNVPGRLVAEFSYAWSDDPTTPLKYPRTVMIPTLIIGSGEPPVIERNSEYFAQYTADMDKGATLTSKMFTTTDEKKLPVAGLKMDVYDGKVARKIYDPLEQPGAYRLEATRHDLNVNFGTDRNAAVAMAITARGDADAVRVETARGGYTWGDKYKPDRKADDVHIETLKIFAEKEGNVVLTFTFYGPTDRDVMTSSTISLNLSVVDHRPNDDPYLKLLELGTVLMPVAGSDEEKARITELQRLFKMKYPAGNIDYGFSAENVSYASIRVPNIVEKVTLMPVYRDEKNNNRVYIEVVGVAGVQEIDPKDPASNKTTEIVLPTNGRAADITVRALAQSGREITYRLQITREVASMDSALRELVVKPEANSPEADYYAVTPTPFDPDHGVYEVEVPYLPDYVWVQAVSNSDWSSNIEIKKKNDPITFMDRLAAVFKRDAQKKIEALKYDEAGTDENYKVTEVEVTVTPENTAASKRTYTLHIIRQDPSDNAEIVEPKVSYWRRGNTREEIALKMDNYTPPPNRTLFTETVSYSANQVRVVITPQDSRAQKVTVRCGDKVIEKPHKAAGGAAQPLDFVFTDVGALFDAENMLKLYVTVDAEKPGVVTDPPYVINIERVPPNRDTTADVTLTNTITNAGIDFGYQAGYMNHTYEAVEVEYEPGDMQVLVTVVPKATSTAVKINNQDPRPIGDGSPGGTLSVPLTSGQTTTIVIVLTAEDNSTNTITIPVKYKLPSKAAYLQNLTVGTLPFLPQPTPFDKKKTTYSVEVPKGTVTLPVTATLLKDGSADDSSKATIKINGKPVKDAEAFNFMLTEKTGKIEIVVTAQDGKTKRTYVVNYKNWNLIVPKEENMLKSLRVEYGELSPKFASNVQEYDVYVKPDAKEIKIYPKLKDKNGALRVVAGKVLAEFDGAYTTTIMEDEMDIFIYVWSEKDVSELAGTVNPGNDTPAGESVGTGTSTDMRLDRAKARQYVLHLYRGDEENMGSFKPTTADQVDFVSADPIVIDITQYPIVSADVFNTLKTEYPEKSILFKGNDYTIQCFGEDINGLVPNAQSFDLRFSFYTPDEDKIVDLMNDYGGNGRVDPVYYYFDQHGALPAEMLLTVDLGRAYRNQTLFWNYYNEERERIDYYGYVRTNASGSFSVPISHFSTFLTTDIRVRGAENKSDEYGNPVDVVEENLNSSGSSGRRNPNTGVRG